MTSIANNAMVQRAALATSVNETIATLRTTWADYSAANSVERKLSARLRSPARPGSGPGDAAPVVMIIGDNNNGKTSLARHFEASHPPSDDPCDEAAHFPVIAIETPPYPTLTSLGNSVLTYVGCPIRFESRGPAKWEQLKSVLTALGARVLIFDHFEHILANPSVQFGQTLRGLRDLAMELHVCIVLVGSVEMHRLAMRRLSPDDMSVWTLPLWTLESERLHFLKAISSKLGLKRSSRLDREPWAPWIFAQSDGRLGGLVDAVQLLIRVAYRPEHMALDPIAFKELTAAGSAVRYECRERELDRVNQSPMEKRTLNASTSPSLTSRVSCASGLWPVRPRPLPDETLSSWLARIAHAQGLSRPEFARRAYGVLLERDRRTDERLPVEAISIISRMTGVEREQVESMSLAQFEPVLGPMEQIYERMDRWSPWLLDPMRGPGVPHCPSCLGSDRVAYMRRTWFVAFSVVCSRHRTRLRDRCPYCKCRIGTWDGAQPLRECPMCGKDYVKDCTKRFVAPDLAGRFSTIDVALTSGEVAVKGQGLVPAREYFAVLGHLAEVAVQLGDFAHHVIAEWYHVPLTQFPYRIHGEAIASLRASERFRALRVALLLLSDWPEGFSVLLRGSLDSTNSFLSSFVELPEWYVSTVSDAPLRGPCAAWLVEKSDAYRLAKFGLRPDD